LNVNSDHPHWDMIGRRHGIAMCTHRPNAALLSKIALVQKEATAASVASGGAAGAGGVGADGAGLECLDTDR
jgi:hypothetical protein